MVIESQKLERYRQILRSLRERVGGDVNYVVESIHEDVSIPEDVSAAPVHLADMAMESVEKDVEVLSTSRAIFEEVNAALNRIDAGTFGQCTQCGGPISEERLKAIPYAALCVRCAKTERAEEAER